MRTGDQGDTAAAGHGADAVRRDAKESAEKRAELIHEVVFEALLSNANFWAPSDAAAARLAPELSRRTTVDEREPASGRYFAGTEALEALAWLVTSVAVPFVVGVASSRVASQMGQSSAVRREVDAARTDVVAPVAEALIRRDPRRASRDDLDLAEEHVRLLLIDYGWPAREARDDAGEIVSRVASTLRPR